MSGVAIRCHRNPNSSGEDCQQVPDIDY
ncbi:hypothetical protein ID866_5954 [Astraeus odoratus]|nr:hypothetical protein ID866_5954 [Astraeus odoratus]